MTEADPDAESAAAALAPLLAEAIRHLNAGRPGAAEDLVRRRLADYPDDVLALCILSDLATRAGALAAAAELLQRAVDLAPLYGEARYNLARILARLAEVPRALAELEMLLTTEPDNQPGGILRLTLLAQTGRHDEAVAGRDLLLAQTPDDPYLWITQANELKTIGRRDQAIAAFRHALTLDPRAGEAYWGMANLKVGALDATDVAAMRASIDAHGEDSQRSIPTHFALARALEDAGDFEHAFRHYASGNALQRRTRQYDATATTAEIEATIAQFTPQFVADRAGLGCPSSAPIFILGMPRAGSTLVEQILASHSLIEGTSELPIVPALVNRALGADRTHRDGTFAPVLARMDGTALRGLGERYLAAASCYRHTDRPFFIDKLPTNWMDLALLCTMLPNVRIVDARREGMACCFANWKQYFPLGHGFSNDLRDIALYYRDYVRTLAHFDTVLPGRIVRVEHARMVEDPEREIRSLLDRLALPFEADCLTPHRTNRPVRTASSEQVRRPISAAGTDAWRNFAPWLGDLKTALGDLA